VIWDEKHGWIRYTPDTSVEAAPVNMLEVKRRRKTSYQEQPECKDTLIPLPQQLLGEVS
jgi:hypothetical protein